MKTFDNEFDQLLATGEQLSFNLEMENKRSANSKPMSGEEYKQKIARATERYIKRKELLYATNDGKIDNI